MEDLIRNFYKKGTNKIDPAKIIVTLLFTMTLIFIGICNRDKRLQADIEGEKGHRYTIGVTEKIYRNLKSSTPNFKYHYDVNFIRYSDFESIYKQNEDKVIANGGRYFVEFSNTNPGNCKLLLDYPVPDSISNAPFLGWTKIPVK